MKYLSILFISLVIFSCKENNADTAAKTEQSEMNSTKNTTYYFIRHAEKDRKAETNDPHLLPKGMDRAKFWAEWFSDKNLEMVYSTNYQRTLETARPTAEKAEVTIELYKATDLYDDEFRTATKGKTVLVVGHSDTTPMFINKILGTQEYSDIPDNENGNVYTVTIFPNGKISTRQEQPNFDTSKEE